MKYYSGYKNCIKGGLSVLFILGGGIKCHLSKISALVIKKVFFDKVYNWKSDEFDLTAAL